MSAYERYLQSKGGGSSGGNGASLSPYQRFKQGITTQLPKPTLNAKAGGGSVDLSVLKDQLAQSQAESKKSSDFLKMPWWKQIFQPQVLNKDVLATTLKTTPGIVAKKAKDFIKEQATGSPEWAIGTESAAPYALKLYKNSLNRFNEQTDIINKKIATEKDPERKKRLNKILEDHLANRPVKTDFNEALGWSKKQILAKGGLAAADILMALPIGGIIKGGVEAATVAGHSAPIFSRPLGQVLKETGTKLLTKEGALNAAKSIGSQAAIGAGYGAVGAVGSGVTKPQDIAKEAAKGAAITPLLAGGLHLGARGISELLSGEIKRPFSRYKADAENIPAPKSNAEISNPQNVGKPNIQGVDSLVKSRSIPKELNQLTDIAKKTDKENFIKEYGYIFDKQGHKNFMGTVSDFYDMASKQNRAELNKHPIIEHAKNYDNVDSFTKEIQKVTSGTGKNLLPNEVKIRQSFEDYAKNPAVQDKYPNGATKSQIISDLFNKSRKIKNAQEAVGAKFESKVFSRLKNENPEALKGTLKYDTRNLKADSEAAVKLISEDKQKAFQVAMDNSHPLSVATNIALSEKALSEGNHKLYGQLVKSRSLEQTRRGQGLVAEKGSITDNSTSRYVRELINNRLDKLGEKYTSTIDPKMINRSTKEKAMVAVENGVKKIESKIKNKKLDTKTALSLLDKLTCLT